MTGFLLLASLSQPQQSLSHTPCSVMGVLTCPSRLVPWDCWSTSQLGRVSTEGLISHPCQLPRGTFPCFSLVVGLDKAGSQQGKDSSSFVAHLPSPAWPDGQGVGEEAGQIPCWSPSQFFDSETITPHCSFDPRNLRRPASRYSFPHSPCQPGVSSLPRAPGSGRRAAAVLPDVGGVRRADRARHEHLLHAAQPGGLEAARDRGLPVPLLTLGLTGHSLWGFCEETCPL